jgi:hypothetical protein
MKVSLSKPRHEGGLFCLTKYTPLQEINSNHPLPKEFYKILMSITGQQSTLTNQKLHHFIKQEVRIQNCGLWTNHL